jgi:hypothetical protein
VLVGEDHELDVLDRVPEPLDPALELVKGGAGVRSRVYERERVVPDEVDVHAADGERRGNGESVDAGGSSGGKGSSSPVVATWSIGAEDTSAGPALSGPAPCRRSFRRALVPRGT